MKQRGFWGMLCGFLVLLFMAVPVSADQLGEAKQKAHCSAEKEADQMAQADRLLEKSDQAALKQAIGLYEKIIECEPENFEALWKCAKAHREYGETYKKQRLNQWQDVCRNYGKKGMAYAQKAIEIESKKPHGYLFYGLNVGIYADGAGILTALKEGLKDKTQKNLQKAYELDKSLEEGAPIVALGRFWQVVPWPFNDKDKAESLYREFQKTDFYEGNAEARVYLAELLADKWGSAPEKEARKLLQEARQVADDPYWRKKAQAMLNDL